jgi:hypothetical protein
LHCRWHSLPALFRGHVPLHAFNVPAISLLQSLWHLASADDASARHVNNDRSTRARRLWLDGAAASKPTIRRIIFFSALPGSPILRARPKSSHPESRWCLQRGGLPFAPYHPSARRGLSPYQSAVWAPNLIRRLM